MKDKLRIIFCLLIAVLSLTTIILKYNSSKNESDAYKFKNEYEIYNKRYIKLNIDKDNPVKYVNEDELIDIIKNKTGIIFLGYPDSNESRNAINVLLVAAKDTGIKDIYYKNIKKFNTDEIAKKIDDEVKAPTVIFVREGKVLGSYSGVVEQDDKDKLLNDEEQEELYTIYTNFIHQVLNDLCDEEC